MDPILKHNLTHNGLENYHDWKGFRFETHEYGVMEVYEKREKDSGVYMHQTWRCRMAYDPEGYVNNNVLTSEDLMDMYTRQLERFVKKLQKDFS